MDSERFDRIVRGFGQARSRRQTLRGLAGLLATGAFALAVPEADALRCSKRKPCPGCQRCRKRRCKPDATQNGAACGDGKVCCGGVCTALGTDDNCGSCSDRCVLTCQACTGEGTCAPANEGEACSDGTRFCRSGACIGDNCIPAGGDCSGGGECCGGGCRTEVFTCCVTGSRACVEDADCCNDLLTCSGGVCREAPDGRGRGA